MRKWNVTTTNYGKVRAGLPWITNPITTTKDFRYQGRVWGFGAPCLPVVSLPWVVLGMHLGCGSGRQLCFFMSVKLPSVAGMGSGGHRELPH